MKIKKFNEPLIKVILNYIAISIGIIAFSTGNIKAYQIALIILMITATIKYKKPEKKGRKK